MAHFDAKSSLHTYRTAKYGSSAVLWFCAKLHVRAKAVLANDNLKGITQ